MTPAVESCISPGIRSGTLTELLARRRLRLAVKLRVLVRVLETLGDPRFDPLAAVEPDHVRISDDETVSISTEPARGTSLNERTRVRLAGLFAYELLALRPFRRHAGSPVGTALTRIFPDIERIVARALDGPSEERYRDVAEMRADVEGLVRRHGQAMAAAEAEIIARSERALAQARTLVSEEQMSRAAALLRALLRGDPDNVEARRVLSGLNV